jgi:hypothetical protein
MMQSFVQFLPGLVFSEAYLMLEYRWSLNTIRCYHVNDYNVCVGITYNLVWIYLDFSKGH